MNFFPKMLPLLRDSTVKSWFVRADAILLKDFTMKSYGLTTSQAQESKARHGDNRLTELETEGFWSKFRGNLSDPMIKILCVALFINVVFVFLGQTEWYESVGIAIAVMLAVFVSTFSEYRNENAFQRLQAEASRIMCKAYRDGQIAELSIDDLVAGDCVLLQPGDKIPADGIIVEGELQVDQSVLNGETKEAQKIVMPAGYGDQGSSMDFLNKYKLFRGSVACSGNAVMTITTIGDKSVYGQLASELQKDDDRDTPLKVKLKNLANGISKFGYIGGAGIALALLFQRIVIHNGFDMAKIIGYCSNWMTVVNDITQALMLAVIIIVMAVPEGLPLMVAIVSALNMGKMLKDNVLVRKIAGMETAGSLNILFSDKTGTITKGELEAVAFVSGSAKEYKTLDGIEDELGKLLSLSICGNTSAVVSNDGSSLKAIGGNATERAILKFAFIKSGAINVISVNSIPFTSANKYSASQVEGDYDLSLIKGAPEKILGRCKYYYDEKGKAIPLADSSALSAKIDEMASRAIRVLALATSMEKIKGDALPDGDWVLVGILGIRDEIRPESIAAIGEAQNAGVQVVMITGDRRETAVAIAKEAGLLQDSSSIVLTSDELAGLSDEELKNKLKDIRVIARALPSDKSRLVRVAQELNLVAGMTGDGVNDSPALKAADLGFAMGSGTEVAKEASEVIILDDNFTSIGKAILYGRTIFNTIRKFIMFQLTINMAAVLISFICPLLGMELPLTIIQILWINLVMDTLAALAFGGEPALKRYMREKPKKRDENIVSGYMWSTIVTGVVLTFGLSMFFLLSGFPKTVFRPDAGEKLYLLTGFFAFFLFVYIFNAFNVRTDRFNLFDNITRNKGFLSIIALIVVVQILMVYLGGDLLRCYGLSWNEWIFILAMAFVIIPVDLLRKFIVKGRYIDST
jgi:calcium-translocating P-type ATPase